MTNAGRILLAALVGGTLLRVVMGSMLGLGIDEQYVLAVARDFQWSFLDHPPLGFWMGTLAWKIGGSIEPIAMRWPFILLAIVTTLLIFRFTSRLFGPAAAAWAAVVFNLAPLFAIVGGSWIMPDGPLLAAAMGSACCLVPIILESPERPVRGGRAWGLWLAAGGLLGLALLAKYLAVFYAIGVVVFVASVPGVRRWLRHPAPYVGCLLGLAVFSPVLIWNAQNDWASFAFQGGRATNQGGMKPLFVVQMVFGAALYLAPWIWWPMVAEGVKAARPGRADRGAWFCLCVAVPTILALTIIPLWGKRGLPHWPAVGFLFLLPILGRATAMALAEGGRPRRIVAGWLWFSTIALPVVAVALLLHARFGIATPLIPEEARAKDPTLDSIPWTPLRSILIEGGVEPGAPDVVLAAGHWIEGGRAGAALGNDWPLIVADGNAHHFPFLHDREDFVGDDVVFVGTLDRVEATTDRYADRFDGFEELGRVDLERGGEVVMTLVATRGRVLRSPLPPLAD
ncbi:MAG: glycosyltransferase family 39 protein [Planctomycetota bacterium]|nr:glycosyltransferase family 39 protein [Planctomycetota bacterium]